MQTHFAPSHFSRFRVPRCSAWVRNRLLVSIGMVLTLTLMVSDSAAGQSFLEKLEAAVREQLNQPNSNPVSSEELPAPDKPPVTPTPATPPDGLPSILENDPEKPRPTDPGSGVAASNGGAKGTGQVYLGLEAEELVGGGIGVRVSSVADRSPAWESGFQVGDRILAVNGFAIANLDGMVSQLSKTSPGQVVKFLVSRDGKNFDLTSVLMDASLANKLAGKSSLPTDASVGSAWLGASVNDLTASFRQQFGITAFRGAAVTQVASGSPAARAGIRAGDTIIEAGAVPIEGAADLSRWMAQTRPGQSAELIIYRGSIPRSVRLVLEVSPEDRPRRSVSRLPDTTAAPTTAVPTTATPLGLAPSVAEPTGAAPPRDAQPTADPNGTDAAVIRELSAENMRLKAKLADAERRLSETQQRLNEIVNGLNGIK